MPQKANPKSPGSEDEDWVPYNGQDKCEYFEGTDDDGSSHKGYACVCQGDLCNTRVDHIGEFTGLTIYSVLVISSQNQ